MLRTEPIITHWTGTGSAELGHHGTFVVQLLPLGELISNNLMGVETCTEGHT